MNGKLKVLDLFSGIGGFSLGLEATGGFETVAFCEIEEYPCAVLKKHWPDVPIFNDVRTLTHDSLKRVLADANKMPGFNVCGQQPKKREPPQQGSCIRSGGKDRKRESAGDNGHRDPVGSARPIIDVLTGGYPCQPFSLAGKRRGAEDDRHLWPEMHRLVATIRPRWVIAENVAGHINMGLDEVLSDLEGEGYTCWPLVIPACAVDAPHRRDRVWIVARDTQSNGSGEERSVWQGENTKPRRVCEAVADTNPTGQPPSQGCGQGDREARDHAGRRGEDVANPTGWGLPGCQSESRVTAQGNINLKTTATKRTQPTDACRWLLEPNVGRVAHGIPKRVDRLKCLGNAIVPAIVTQIGYAILEAGVK